MQLPVHKSHIPSGSSTLSCVRLIQSALESFVLLAAILLHSLMQVCPSLDCVFLGFVTLDTQTVDVKYCGKCLHSGHSNSRVCVFYVLIGRHILFPAWMTFSKSHQAEQNKSGNIFFCPDSIELENKSVSHHHLRHCH